MSTEIEKLIDLIATEGAENGVREEFCEFIGGKEVNGCLGLSDGDCAQCPFYSPTTEARLLQELRAVLPYAKTLTLLKGKSS